MFGWLWFGGCKKQLAKCEQRLADALERIDELKKQVSAATDANEKLRKQIDALKEYTKNLEAEINKLHEDCKYFEERIKQLTRALSTAVEIPDISEFIAERKKVRPWQIRELVEKYNVVVADLEYYAFPKAAWKKILDKVWMQKLKLAKFWKKEVLDCDDHAIIMHGLVTATFGKTELDHQGAFMIVWSNVHAYNAFMDIEGNVWIYEPQTNHIVGKLGETGQPYNSKKIWFPGEQTSYTAVYEAEVE